MLSNRFGISNYWKERTYSKQYISDFYIINTLLIYLFNKFKIIISDLNIKEFPYFYNISFIINPLNEQSYKNINNILFFIKALLAIILKKNVNFEIKLSNNLFNDINLIHTWLNLKLFRQPLKIKKIIKSLENIHDSVTFKS